MKTVIVTGISGTDIETYANEWISLGNQSRKAHWEQIRFAELMKEVDFEWPHIKDNRKWEDGILRRSTALPHLRSAAFKRLLEIKNEKREIEKDTGIEQVLIITTHATFWFHKTLVTGIDPTLITELDPTFFITVVDDVIDCWKRLLATNQDRWEDLSPVDMLEWREIEVFTTKIIASICSQRGQENAFYLIARKYPPSTVVDIIIKTPRPKVYRSYPITFVKNYPDVQASADDLGKELEKIFVVFDPMGIKDLDRMKELKKAYDDWCKNKGYNESQSSWDEIAKHLKNQTVTRDHGLIDQSDGIVVYYPEIVCYFKENEQLRENRIVPFSSGVLDEMQYAIQYGKWVYLVWTKADDGGPFLSKLYTRKFDTVDGLLNFLSTKTTD